MKLVMKMKKVQVQKTYQMVVAFILKHYKLLMVKDHERKALVRISIE